MKTATSEAPQGDDRYSVAVVTHALDLLTALGHGPLTTSQAARIIGKSRSTAYRLLVTLSAKRYAAHDDERHEWLPGPALLALGAGGQVLVLRALALPGMRRLHEEENETVNLGQYVGGELTYVEILESNQLFRTSAAPGQQANLHSTALGKAILAALPEPLLQSTLDRIDLHARTPFTRTERSELRREIEAVRARGWSEEKGEDAVGVGCVGAAILSVEGMPIGGISVSAPQARLDEKRTQSIGERVAEEVGRITRDLAVGRAPA
jgi:DNA-binding IclR family transcriptional regulator